MAFSNTSKHVALDAIGAVATWLSVHTADPGTTGANEVASSTRAQTTWSPASGGTKTGTVAAIGVPAGATITHWGLWTGSSGGTFHTGNVLPATEVYGSAGVYNATPTLSA
jgi:hypothetical protein